MKVTISLALALVAIFLFGCAWYIAESHGEVFGWSANAGAFGYAGLAFFVASTLPWKR